MKKVGIITFHASHNYGSMLQAYALQQVVLSMGYDCAIINFNECPHVPKLAKFKPPRCPIGVYWNTLCLMRDVWTIKTYMI